MRLKLVLVGAWCVMASIAALHWTDGVAAAASESRASLDSKLDQLELMWQAGQRSAYFARAAELVQLLPYQVADVAQPAGLRLMRALLDKQIPASTKDAFQIGSADLTTMTALGRFLSVDYAIPAGLEQQKVQLLATLLGRLRAERVPGYVWQEVYLNVPPPPGVRGVSGMNPDEIEDPVAREKYKAARRENSLRNLQNKRQRALEDAELIVARPIIELLKHAAKSDRALADTVAKSVPQARLTESEKKEVLGVRTN